MEYLFENLGPERFQEFCHCLISNEYPHSQSFPIGMPDGGRDSVVYTWGSGKREFIVFQVKYVRDPSALEDRYQWLANVLEEEAKKMLKLIPSGAQSFYLLTNVRGSGHPTVGSKDKVHELLNSTMDIPAVCWWRDDLSRLFEKDPMFKWSFPELLNGQEILNSILFNHITEEKDKRESIVRAYLADQYSIDNKVKFRQIDLENSLFELFTDVPLRVRKYNERNKAIKRVLANLESHQVRATGSPLDVMDSDTIGAAQFFLNTEVQSQIQRILLEGGPGQGKSTISQYICQVHRARLLNKTDDLRQLPDDIKSTSIKLPIKIDLRHVATWVERRNPYQETFRLESFERIWKNSLESFLIGHVVHHSGIDSFDSADLLAIFRTSCVLMVFDGFDEIADFDTRGQVIEFINKGLNRLSENAKSLQVLITSRPAAFSESIGFSVDTYPHFELTDITDAGARDYVNRWAIANKLAPRERSEIKRLADEKLKLPHLRELAKSPMQLAIFISLLRTKGESLPHKRTSLYDSYVDLFFNRESEKNATIRDHRDLIIDIHQYLAWRLHSDAELLNNNGSLHINELRPILQAYLENEGHGLLIADQLFHVMEERVCALVSRVQGTYEFEVQPLREYFCAKFLYGTAPYSPAGAEQAGTKPERFDAISRNFYWHNVVRFFAGCFDKGELPMLIQKLKELQDDELLRNTNYPRLLTSQILSDWVFTQYPRLLNDVVKIIVDGINIGGTVNQGRTANRNDSMIIPKGCGRRELVEECFMQLKRFPKEDYAMELIGILSNNPLDTVDLWQQQVPFLSGSELTKWLRYGYYLELIHEIDGTVLSAIVNDCDDEAQKIARLQITISGNRFDIIKSDGALKRDVFEHVLDGKISVIQRKHSNESIQTLSIITHPGILRNAVVGDYPGVSFIDSIYRRWGSFLSRKGDRNFLACAINDEVDEQIQSFLDSVAMCVQGRIDEWRSSLSHWDTFVESFRLAFGDRWSIYVVSVLAAGIKSRSERGAEESFLSDATIPLCQRVRSARMRSGNTMYWEAELDKAEPLLLTLLVLFTWVTPRVLIHCAGRITSLVESLTAREFIQLSDAVGTTASMSVFEHQQLQQIMEFCSNHDLSPDVRYLISFRVDASQRGTFLFSEECVWLGRANDLQELRIVDLIESFFRDTTNRNLLLKIKEAYGLSSRFVGGPIRLRASRSNLAIDLPIEIANEVMKESTCYPRVIASVAERVYRVHANKLAVPVATVAEKSGWFKDQKRGASEAQTHTDH